MNEIYTDVSSIKVPVKISNPVTDPKLRTIEDALAEVAPVLQKYSEYADQVSKDIKSCEALLKKHGLAFEVYRRVAEPGLHNHCEVYGSTLAANFLAWIKDEHGNFRLQKATIAYHESQAEGIDAMTFSGESIGEVVECRPLIECSLEDRMRLAIDLPKFIDEVKYAVGYALI